MTRFARNRLRRLALVLGVCLCIWFAFRHQSLSTVYSTALSYKGSAEYFAKTLKITVKVVENLLSDRGGVVHLKQVTISNPGAIDFQGYKWEIYFTQIYVPIPGQRLVKDGGIEISHVQGQVYMFTPTPDFRPIHAGGSYSFSYISRGSSLQHTDTFPNWYLVYAGSKPYVLESTRGDPAKFSMLQDTPQSWKANSQIGNSDFDRHNPPTSADRFVLDSSPDLSHDPVPIIPKPLTVSKFDKNIEINMHDPSWVIVGEARFHNEMEFLANAWQLKISASKPSDYFIKFERANSKLAKDVGDCVSSEAYSLTVSPSKKKIVVFAYNGVGAFNAIQSLIALRNAEGKLPAITISDAPRFKYRGLMLDIARNFHSKETIERLIRLMALYKLNKLHLHLSDDEGWRLEIPGLKELTSVGSVRCHDLEERKCLLPFLGSGPDRNSSGTGYLTVNEYKDILRYAIKHHIEVIPEIDVPGHAHAAVVAMKQRYLNTGSAEYLLTEANDFSSFESIQGFTDNVINPCLSSTQTFMRKVFTEIYNMHRNISPLTVFHFGGDEVPESSWSQSPSCRNLSKTTSSIKHYFLHQMSLILNSLGLDIAAWEDGFKESDEHHYDPEIFPQKNVYAYSWKNAPHLGLLKTAYSMANSGYKVVLASATNLYLDHVYEPDAAERGLFWATRYINARRSFSFSPLNLYSSTTVNNRGNPVDYCAYDEESYPSLQRPQNVEGMEAVLFGELITSEDILDYMLLPRLLAVAERAWHKAKWETLPIGSERKALLKEDWTKFANTLGYRELPRLDRLGYHYRISPPGARLSTDRTMMEVNVMYPGQQVEISRNGGWGWAAMLKPITKINPGENIKLRTKAGTRTSRAIMFDPNRSLDIED